MDIQETNFADPFPLPHYTPTDQAPLTPNTVAPPNPALQDGERGKEGEGEECTPADILQPSKEHEEGSFSGSSSVQENTSAMVNLA